MSEDLTPSAEERTLAAEPQLVAAAEYELSDGRLAGLAARLGCTEGQVYTMAIAMACAIALVLLGGVPLGNLPRDAAVAGPAPSPAPAVVLVPAPSPSAPATLTPLNALPLPQPSPVGGVSAVPDPGPSQGWQTPPPPSGPFRVPAPGFPAALAADARNVYVGSDNTGAAASQLFVLSRTDGNARTIGIGGQNQSHTGGLAAAVVAGDQVLAVDRSRGALLEIDPRSGAQHLLVRLPDLPPCVVGVTGTCQPGAQDAAPAPEGLALRGSFAFIADTAQGTIWRYGLDSHQLTAWFASSDFSAGSGPSGLALDSAGQFYFTVDTSANPSSFLQPALYRLSVASDGTAGTAALVTTFASGSSPGPVAVGRSGQVYVGLRAAGGVVVVPPTGGSRALSTPGVKILTPTGLCLVDGLLYVADQGRPASTTSGLVLSIPVSDGPAQ